jgi:hypothetical protein
MMAKRRRRKRGFLGSAIRVRKLDGLGQMIKPGSLIGSAIPPIIGGGTAVATTVGIRQFENAPAALVQFSPWVGLGASTLVASIIYNTQSKPAGVAAFMGGIVGTFAIVFSEWLAKQQLFKMGTSGLDAIVPEYAGGTSGVGAIVMEPHASRGYGAGPLGGRYGETVNLNLGSINSDAFGSQMFQV